MSNTLRNNHRGGGRELRDGEQWGWHYPAGEYRLHGWAEPIKSQGHASVRVSSKRRRIRDKRTFSQEARNDREF